MVGGAAQLGATAGSAAQAGGAAFGPSGYFADMLFRSNQARTDGSVSITPEAGRIFSNALIQSVMPSSDKTYLGQLVAARTGLCQTDLSLCRTGRNACDASLKVDQNRPVDFTPLRTV